MTKNRKRSKKNSTLPRASIDGSGDKKNHEVASGGGGGILLAPGDAWDVSRLNKNWAIDQKTKTTLPLLAKAKREEQESAGDKFLRLSKLAPPPAPITSLVLDMNQPQNTSSESENKITPVLRSRYFGPSAKLEFYQIFRTLAAQKYMLDGTTQEFFAQHPLNQSKTSQILAKNSNNTSLQTSSCIPEGPADVGNDLATRIPLRTGRSEVIGRDTNATTNGIVGTPSNVSATTLLRQPSTKIGLFTEQFTARHKFSSLCLEKDLPPCLRLIIRNYLSPEINVSHMAMGDEMGTIFAQCLTTLPMVTGVNVRNNRLGDQGLQAIIHVVIEKKDLYHIDLSENKVDTEASKALANYLGNDDCALQSLKLSSADIVDGELVVFAKALEKNKSLRLLEMGHNLIGSSEHLNVVKPSIITGGEALATMLTFNQTLTILDLSWNYLRLGGAVEIGKALACNKSLKELNLSYNAFGNDGAQAIGEALLNNTTLEKINLSNNNIPSQGALVIANGLKSNMKVIVMNLDGNPLGQTSGRALFHAVANTTNRNLIVTMDGCNFDVNDPDGFDENETTGKYDLNMKIPYERAIAFELLRIANTKQGCKFTSILHVFNKNKNKKQIKVELKEIEGNTTKRKLLKGFSLLTDYETDEEQLKKMLMDRNSLEKMFKELDEDDSGFIDIFELKKGMNKLDIHMEEEELSRLIAQYDLDRSNTIEIDEFIELMGNVHVRTAFAGNASHFIRQVIDLETNEPFIIPKEGRLLIDFVDLHVAADDDNAHCREGIERLIENLSKSTNKSQMLGIAKNGLFFKENEAQLLLDKVMENMDPVQAVVSLLPNMVDAKHAFGLINTNLTDPMLRYRLQQMMGNAFAPILGIATGHYRLDLNLEMDRLALKKIMEQSNRTALLRKKDAKMDTSQHVNHQGFRNEVFNGKPFVLEPNFLDKLPKFGILEFDYVQMHRQINGRPISEKRLEQVIKAVHLHLMGPHINPEAIKTLFSSTVSSIPNSSTQNRRRKSTIGNTTRKKSSISGGQMEKRKSQAAIKAAQFFGTTGVPELIYYTPETFNLLDQMYHVNNFVEYGKGLKDVIEYQLPGLEKNEEKGVTQDGQVTTIEEKKNKEEESNSEEEEKEIEEKEKNAANNTRASVAKVQAHRMNSRYRRHQNREVTKLKLKAKQMTPGGDKESCTARRLLLNLQWLLANRWVTCLQSIQLLYLWPKAFADSRIELIFILFDRLADLHNFIFIMAVLTEQEAAQVFYRLGWLNVWSPIIPDNYYELNITRYEEREIAKMLVRLSIDEPGENWQGESFGWSKEENIPGWELNMSWLKDGGFPEKGYLRLEYYSGADKGGESVWPTRRELAALTLGGIPADIEKLSILVDAWSRQRRRKSTLPARARSLTEENPFD